MKMRRKYFVAVLVLIFLLSISALAQSSLKAPIKDGSLGAKQEGGKIKVTWTSESESGINHYEVWRDNECVQDNIPLLGNYQFYSIDDNKELYKTTGNIFHYKVRAIYSEDHTSFLDSPVIITSYNSTSSTAKRTWGSIKAMFR